MHRCLSVLLAVVTVQFNPETYTVTEGGRAQLTITLSGVSTSTVTVNLATDDGSARGTD